MCTVTYLRADGITYLTSNRDEAPGRHAPGLSTGHDPLTGQYSYPPDPSSGGSWIALSAAGRAVCLLNGGYVPFTPAPPYRQSRGLVVRDAVLAPDALEFLHQYPLEHIAPFTLLVYENDLLHCLVWTGERRDLTQPDPDTPAIWSSATLYPEPVRTRRRALFDEWLRDRTSFDREAIIGFHRTAGDDPENDFIMNRRDIVKTLSVTNIMLGPEAARMLHVDLEQPQQQEIAFRYGP